MSKNSEPQSVPGQTLGELDKESVDAPPPILGQWGNLYLAVIAVTLLVYGLLFLFSAYAR